MNINDIKILQILEKEDCTNNLKSFTVKRISNEVNLSQTKVRYTMPMLNDLGYANKGFSNGKSQTYYITEKGIEFLRRCLNGTAR